MSSQSWFRGSVCGVDNCRLRLYRSRDGLTICQYGHVVEGDIEFNDEEDMVMTQTRRLNAVRVDAHGAYMSSQMSQQGIERDAPTFLKGKLVLDACIRCLQILLKHQLDQIIRAYMIESVREDLTTIVKTNWITFLEYSISHAKTRPQSADKEDDEEDNEENGDSASLSNSSGRLYPNALDTIAIIYILALQLRQYPLYAIDLLKGIRDHTIAYTQAFELFPPESVRNIPAQFKFFQPAKLPTEGKFMGTIGDMGVLLLQDHTVEFHHYLPLCYRTLSVDLGLPNFIDIFAALSLLVSHYSHELAAGYGKRSATRGLDVWLSLLPEIAACGLLIEVILCFLGSPQLWVNKHVLDIKHWVQLLRQQHESRDYLSAPYSSLSIHKWLDTKIASYCDWIERTVVPKRLIQGSDQDLLAMEKRLWLIFNMGNFLALASEPESPTLVEQVARLPTTNAPITRTLLEEATQLLYRHFARVYGISERAIQAAHVKAQEKVTAPITEVPIRETLLARLRFQWQ